MDRGDKVLLVERYRGRSFRETYLCGECRGEVYPTSSFCPWCGIAFRSGYRREEVTR